jgi:hypothetical protein
MDITGDYWYFLMILPLPPSHSVLLSYLCGCLYFPPWKSAFISVLLYVRLNFSVHLYLSLGLSVPSVSDFLYLSLTLSVYVSPSPSVYLSHSIPTLISVFNSAEHLYHYTQGILKGEISLYSWPPVWLVWNQLYDNWQFSFLFAKQTNPNRR